MLFKLAWRNLWRQKRRSLLTASALALALFLSLLTRCIQEGTYSHNIDNAARFATGLIQLQHPQFHHTGSIDDLVESNDNFIAKAKQLQAITHLLPRIESFALAAGESSSKAAMVMAGIPGKEQDYSGITKYLVEGEFIQSQDKQVLIGQGLADYLKLNLGDDLVLYGQGYRGQTAAGLYPIKGILSFPTPGLDDKFVYLPLTLAQSFFSTGDKVTHHVIHLSSLDALNRTRDELTELYPQLAVRDWPQLAPEMAQQIWLDKAGGQFMMLLLYAIVGFALFATLMMTMLERQREFGVMLATGMSRARIQILLTIESIFIAMLGVIIGLSITIPCLALLHLYPIRLTGDAAQMLLSMGWDPIIPVKVSAELIGHQILIMLSLLTLCLSYPIWRIQKLSLVDALKGGQHAT